MTTRQLAQRITVTAIASLTGAACASVDTTIDPLVIELDDRTIEFAVDRVDGTGAGDLEMLLRTDELGAITSRSQLDAAGRGTAVLTGDDFRHEIAISDTLLKITYTRHGKTDMVYIARPRGDLLKVLNDYPDEIAPPAAALPAMPLHYLAMRSLELGSATGAIDKRWATIAQATWAFDDRFATDPSTAPVAVTAGAAWRTLGNPTAEPLPTDTVIFGDAPPATCNPLPVSGAAKITGATSPAVHLAGAITCTDGPITIAALQAAGGGGFSKIEQGISWSAGQSSVACPGNCGDVIWGADCYKAYVAGAGHAGLFGNGIVVDGGADNATGPSCTFSAPNLSVSLVGPSVTADAVAGTTDLTISVAVTYELDLISDDFCEATGSGTSSASLSPGGGAPAVCVSTDPPAAPTVNGDASTDPRNPITPTTPSGR